MTESTLYDKRWSGLGWMAKDRLYEEKDVKEKIQEAMEKLKDELLQCAILQDGRTVFEFSNVEKKFMGKTINKIFKEEFGAKLLK